MLKRVLPFLLTLSIGTVLGNWTIPIKQSTASETDRSVFNSNPDAHSFYWEECRCALWTTDSKMWAVIYLLPKPSFTEEARRREFTGSIQLHVLLGANGQVLKAEPYGPLPYGLTEESIKAAKSIKFEPASVFPESKESVWVYVNYKFETIKRVIGNEYSVQAYVFDHFDTYHNGVFKRLEY